MIEGNFLTRVFVYLGERFNLFQFIPLSLILSGVLASGSQIFLSQHFLVAPFLLSAVALFLFLLRLRLFDEFKDYEHDLKHYAHRPLQRGLVSKKDLIKILIFVCSIEFFIAFISSGSAFVLFVIAGGYSLLMLQEFFIRNWMRSHFTMYIFSHEILVIPLFFYICAINGFNLNFLSTSFFWFLVVCVGSLMFLLEITRKVRPREHEIESRDTYTAQYGIRNTSILLIIISLISFISLWQVVTNFKGNGMLPIVGSFVFFMIFLFRLYGFMVIPTITTSKKVFISSIVFVFATCLFLIAFIY